MKKFKLYDLLVNILLILLFLIISCFRKDYTFLIGYFVVGTWQLISMLIHAYYQWFTQTKSRRYYYSCAVVCIIITALVAFIFYPLLLLFYLMLFAAPLLALYYVWICFTEIRIIYRHELIQLK